MCREVACGAVVSPQRGGGLEDRDSGSWKVPVVVPELWGYTPMIKWRLMLGNAGGTSVQK